MLYASRLVGDNDNQQNKDYNISFEVGNTTLEYLHGIISEYQMYRYAGYYGYRFYQYYFTVGATYNSCSFRSDLSFEKESFPENYELHEKLKTFFESLVLEYSAEEVE
jgi:hypothetical protein